MSRRSLIINVIIDAIALTVAFLIMIWIKPATIRLYLPAYSVPFLIFLAIWIIVSLISKKYSVTDRYKPTRAILYIIITNLIISGIAALLIFFLRSDFYSRLVVIGTIGLATLFELFFAYCEYYICNANETHDKYSKIFEAYHKVKGTEPITPTHEPFVPELSLDPVHENIRESITEEAGEEVFRFLAQNIDLNIHNYSILSTTTRFNVNKLPEKAYLKLVNLKRINDIRFINKFFESVNSKLVTGGIFIGCAETISQRKKRILKKYPTLLNRIYYFFDFILKRVFPKFSVTKGIYFFLTRGQNRTISMTETFGRLYSCGFKLVKYTEINGYLYFIVKKTGAPDFPENPTYGPFVKLKRIGKEGKIIYIYKLRTMHPYAEFIQDYIYDKHGTIDGDKADNDFRVTSWGRFFRKLWLDELPSLYNFLKGDIKIVGVRPLSLSKFKMYPDYLQKKRTLFKPGLIPPFYVDLPESFDEHMASENRYLDAYAKHPFRTDWKYFWKAFYNIVFKHARSS